MYKNFKFKKICLFGIIILILGIIILQWDNKNTAWKILKDNQFSMDYPFDWNEKEVEIIENGKFIIDFQLGEHPDNCRGIVYRNDEFEMSFDNSKKSMESFIHSSGFTLINSQIKITDRGDKYIVLYNFTEDGIKYKQWIIEFNCGGYNYKTSVSCSGKQFDKDYSQIIDHIFKSISCERKTKEAEKMMKDALAKIEKVKFQKNQSDRSEFLVLIAEAIEDARKAVEFDHRNPEIWAQRGDIYFKVADFVSNPGEWTIICYKQALKLDPDNSFYQKKLKNAEEMFAK